MRFILDPLSAMVDHPRRAAILGVSLFAISIGLYWSSRNDSAGFLAGFTACWTCISAIKSGSAS